MIIKNNNMLQAARYGTRKVQGAKHTLACIILNLVHHNSTAETAVSMNEFFFIKYCLHVRVIIHNSPSCHFWYTSFDDVIKKT